MQTQKIKLYAAGLVAILTCPCHIPLYGLLLSGTAAGVVLSQHFSLAVGVSTLIFLLFLVISIKGYRNRQKQSHP